MSERMTEADLQREPKPQDAAIIAARLGRRIQRSEVFDADGVAQVLLPHVMATIQAQQRLITEVRRLRAIILEQGFEGADPYVVTEKVMDEALAIRKEQ